MASRGLGTLTLDLILKMGGFEAGMDKAARTADKRMKQIEASAQRMGFVLGAAIAGAATAAVAGVKSAIDFADKLNDMNQRLGVSAEALSGWAYAAKQTGTDIDALGIGLKKLAKNMTEALDPNSQQGKLFESLGVSVVDASGKLREVEAVLPEIAAKFKQLDNATLESALAMDLFGKSGTDLLEFLNQGDDGLGALRDRARELGVELSGATLAAADEFNDTLADIKTIADGLWAQLASELLPALTSIAQILKEGAQAGGGFGSVFGFIADQARAAVKDLQFFVQTGRELAALWETISKPRGGPALEQYNRLRMFDNVQGGVQSTQRIGQFSDPAYQKRSLNFNPNATSALESRLNRAYGPSGGASKARGSAGGKSDAQREAEELKRAYESANARLTEQIALVGATTEAQRVYFDVTQGGLMKLAPAEKEALLLKAQELDLSNARYKAIEDEAEAAKRAADEKTRAIENADEMIEAMRFELSLLGMTNDEREREIALRMAGKDATVAQQQAILDLTDALVKGQREAQFWEDFQSDLAGSFYDAATGAKSLKDAAISFFDSIAKNILRAASEQWAEKITSLFKGGSSGGSSGGGNWIGSLLGALFGGGKAAGGATQAGKLYEVNERGMEMFSAGGRDYLMAGVNGHITPNHKLGRGGSTTINVNVPRNTSYQTAAQAGSAAYAGATRAARRNG